MNTIKYACLAIIFCLPLLSGGQNTGSPENKNTDNHVTRPVAVGLSSGIAFSKTLRKWDENNMEEFTEHLRRFSYGLTFQYRLSPRWFLSTGVIYESKGCRHKSVGLIDSSNDDVQSTGISYNYLTMPLMANIQTAGRVSVYAGAGGYGGYVLDMTIGPFPAGLHNPQQYGDLLDADEEGLERVDLGLAAQTGVILPLNECATLDFQIRFTHGLTSASTDLEFLQRSLLSSISFQYRF